MPTITNILMSCSHTNERPDWGGAAGGGGGGGGREGAGTKAAKGGGAWEEAEEELGLLPLASCQNCLADMLLYADVGSYEQFEE